MVPLALLVRLGAFAALAILRERALARVCREAGARMALGVSFSPK